MILVLGGTTEGRIAVRTLDEAAKPYYYSTWGQWQEVQCAHGQRLCGAMDLQQMTNFCQEHGIRLLVDAAHPFATLLHETVAQCSRQLQIPVVRIERHYTQHTEDIIWCADYAEALQRLETDGCQHLLALTGVKTISRLKPYWQRHDSRFRILDRPESVEMAVNQGYPQNQLLFYGHKIPYWPACDAILTKESGESGGFDEKVQLAKAWQVPLYAVQRPPLPDTFIRVNGEYTLRKEVERLVPDFFPLRIGYTTGSCATAAAKAALLTLLQGTAPEQVAITLPNSEVITLPIAAAQLNGLTATACVIKDSGDDPDVTNGSSIVATVQLSHQPGIHFLQGKGVGRVTLPGLGIPVGGPAINNTPRHMMERELTSLTHQGVDVTISVPGGEELALRTFNPKLGIVEGISIIGTLGIIRPFSLDAFVESIRREVEVCRAIGCNHLIINSGAKSEHYLKALYPNLPAQAFVHYGNFIGRTLQIAQEVGLQQVTMGIMLGKAVKLAEGHLDTHSKTVVMNKEFLSQLAQEAGCSSQVQEVIQQLTLARELWDLLLPEDAQRFFPCLMQHCLTVCAPLVPKAILTLMLLDEQGTIRQTIQSSIKTT